MILLGFQLRLRRLPFIHSKCFYSIIWFVRNFYFFVLGNLWQYCCNWMGGFRVSAKKGIFRKRIIEWISSRFTQVSSPIWKKIFRFSLFIFKWAWFSSFFSEILLFFHTFFPFFLTFLTFFLHYFPIFHYISTVFLHFSLFFLTFLPFFLHSFPIFPYISIIFPDFLSFFLYFCRFPQISPVLHKFLPFSLNFCRFQISPSFS